MNIMYLIKGYHMWEYQYPKRKKKKSSKGKKAYVFYPYLEFTRDLEETRKRISFIAQRPGQSINMEYWEFSEKSPPDPQAIIRFYYGIEDVLSDKRDENHVLGKIAMVYLYYRMGVRRFAMVRAFKGTKGFSFSNIHTHIKNVKALKNQHPDNRWGRLRDDLALFLRYMRPYQEEILIKFYQILEDHGNN